MDTIWGPDAEIVAHIYSPGWGPDGQGAALLAIGHCPDGGYYWHGLIYAMNGFE